MNHKGAIIFRREHTIGWAADWRGYFKLLIS